MRRFRLVELFIALLLAPGAIACLWDYDTLAAEARGRPGVAEVLVGWIDRWPDEVYEVRLQRREAALAADPSDLEAYDDAGVACDRLGRHDEAIAWMSSKRAALDALNEPDAEHEYRYHANLGTFHVHRWIASGAERSAMADVDEARGRIAQAIEINPEAHFGREVVQLRLIEMLLEGRHSVHEMDEQAWADGLLGLVELGNAWGSMDVFARLHDAMAREHGALAALAAFRTEDIQQGGSTPLIPEWIGIRHASLEDSGEVEIYLTIPDGTVPKVRAWYAEARAAADARNRARETYILAKLNSGTHPDDVAWDVFFANWTEPELPKMPDSLLPADPVSRAKWNLGFVVLGAIGLVIGWKVIRGRG